MQEQSSMTSQCQYQVVEWRHKSTYVIMWWRHNASQPLATMAIWAIDDYFHRVHMKYRVRNSIRYENNYVSSLVKRFAHIFLSWHLHSWNSLANWYGRSEQIVIHCKLYIILYVVVSYNGIMMIQFRSIISHTYKYPVPVLQLVNGDYPSQWGRLFYIRDTRGSRWLD